MRLSKSTSRALCRQLYITRWGWLRTYRTEFLIPQLAEKDLKGNSTGSAFQQATSLPLWTTFGSCSPGKKPANSNLLDTSRPQLLPPLCSSKVSLARGLKFFSTAQSPIWLPSTRSEPDGSSAQSHEQAAIRLQDSDESAAVTEGKQRLAQGRVFERRYLDLLCRPLRVFILAGEPSGDAIGSRTMISLQRMSPAGCTFTGIGGPWMEEQGLRSIFPMDDIATMGIMEVVARISRLWVRLRQAVSAATEAEPDVILTIDAKGFASRLLQRLRHEYERAGKEVPLCVHYVAPSYWAWKGGEESLKRWAGLVDHMLCILPFEPATCQAYGLRASFVGHPALEDPWRAEEAEGGRGAVGHGGASFRSRHGLPETRWPDGGPIIALLPGSRVQEVQRMLPILGAAVRQLAGEEAFRGLALVVPTVPSTRQRVLDAVGTWGLPAVILAGDSGSPEKYEALAACDVAVCVSGTAVVQLLRARLPCVVAYRAHPLTEYIARRRAKVLYMSLPNILLDRAAIPEALFSNCTPAIIAQALRNLLADRLQREAQIEAASSFLRMLAPQMEPPGDAKSSQKPKSRAVPSERAAGVILDELERKLASHMPHLLR